MIEVELSIFSESVAEITSVGAEAWYAATEAHRAGINFKTRLAEGVSKCVERNGIEVVEQAVVVHDETGVEVLVFKFGQASVAVVEARAVGRPAGERLEVVGRAKDVTDAVVLDIVEQEIGPSVVDFYLLGIMHVEDLLREVGRISDKGQSRMPMSIGSRSEDAVVLNHNLMCLLAVGEDSTFVVLSYVEVHASGVIVLEVMTVDAMRLFGVVIAIVLVDGVDVEVSQIALIDAELEIEFVAWLDEAVGHVRVNVFLGYRDSERWMTQPFLLAMSVDGDLNILPSAVDEQASPGGGIDVKLAILGSSADDAVDVCHEGIGQRVSDHKVKRRYIRRNRHAAIVGIDDS